MRELSEQELIQIADTLPSFNETWPVEIENAWFRLYELMVSHEQGKTPRTPDPEEIPIQKGVPIPRPGKKGKKSKINSYPFPKMQAGDSIPISDLRRAWSAASGFSFLHKEFKFCARKDDMGLGGRIWRIPTPTDRSPPSAT